MRKLFSLTLIAFALCSLPASAATKAETVDLVAQIYKAPAGTFIYKKAPGPDKRGVRVAYVYNGNRYTLEHDYWVGGIQIWVRKDGTAGARSADALADRDLDGSVDFGTDGAVRIFALANIHSLESKAEGLEHKTYWQKIYDQALAGLKATLDRT